ncbi:MAG: site-2 protease family protein [Elusimicrobia bacterium]|nr:site-2 protease family protein [Elusimicrobiota bacterium]
MMELILFIPLLLFSVIFHEVAHGLVALREGDDTAYVSGRLTLNPIPHLDILGSILFPAICFLTHVPVFGWAKPVPVNPNRFNDYKNGVIRVSLAGPLTNLLIAVLFALALFLLRRYSNLLFEIPILPYTLSQGILLNLVLAVFNLIPIPPLDGSKILSIFLPALISPQYDSLEASGLFIVIGLAALGILGKIIYPPVHFLYALLLKGIAL